MIPVTGLEHLLGRPDQRRIYGVTVGIVTNNKDPDNLGRVKVKFPWLSDSDESQWARVVTPMAGNDRGLYFLPEVDDEVLIAFEHGMIDYPFVIGAMWNGKDKSPESNADGNNNMRALKSRSGHLIRLDDSSGSEKIEIIDKAGNSIVVSASNKTITISADSDITIKSSQGKLKLSGNGVEISSLTGVKIQANTTIDVEASAQASIKGALVKIN